MSNPGQRYAKGSKAWGICQICGLRSLLNDLVYDGQTPWLRVHPDCFSPKHPQERMVRVSDPIALWHPSPEDYLVTVPVLSGVQAGVSNELTWTAATKQMGRLESYKLYKSIDNLTFSLLDSQDVTYSDFGAITFTPSSYTDNAVSAGTTYYYYVEAVDEYNRGLRSNTVTLAVSEAGDFLRLLENGDFRLTESGDLRVLEAAP
jgi:hypothetical protein